MRSLNYVPRVVNVPLTVTLDAYTAADVVGGRLSCVVPQIAGGGFIAWVRLVDDADQAEGYDLHCFYQQPSSIANDAAWAPTEADRLKHFTTINIAAGDYDQSGADASVISDGKDKTAGEYLFFPPLSDNVMYFYLVASDTPDYAAADDLTLDICFMVLR